MRYLIPCSQIFVVTILLSLFANDDVTPKYTMIDFIQMHGYPFESHYAVTKDGYILNLHRIPSGSAGKTNKDIVLLQHGLWTSSMQWVISGPEKSLAFILADAGYDVWMNNDRGNTYSRNHTILDPDNDSQFWNYSWHEIGIHDLPASIDYILNHTNTRQLYYVGQSQGCTAMYVMLSLLPEYTEKIRVYIHMGPAVYMTNLRSIFFRVLAAIVRMIQDIVYLNTGSESLASNGLFVRFSSVACSNAIMKILCHKVYSEIFGPSPTETNTTLISTAVVNVVGGGSSKQLLHFLQGINSGSFQYYDYRTNGNRLQYGQSTPPFYNLSRVNVPGYLMYSSSDYLADSVTDVPRLCDDLPNCIQKMLMPLSTFNHIDYLIGKNADTLVHSAVLKLFSKYR